MRSLFSGIAAWWVVWCACSVGQSLGDDEKPIFDPSKSYFGDYETKDDSDESPQKQSKPDPGEDTAEQPVERLRTFLDEHPSDPNAPRVALDLFMLAAIQKNDALRTEAALRLVLDYPHSMPGAFCVTTFQKASDYRKLLQNHFQETKTQITPQFCRKFAAATQLGIQHWRNEFLSEDKFLLCAAWTAKFGGAFLLELQCQEKLKKAKDQPAQIAKILFADDKDAKAQLIELQAIEDNKLARKFQQCLYSGLSEEDRQSPQVLTMMAENMLALTAFEEALPLVERLTAKDPQPRFLFWKAWSLAALGRVEQARQVVDAMTKQAPKDEWTRAAGQLDQSLVGFSENLQQNVNALHEVVSALHQSRLELIEIKAAFKPQDAAPITCHVGLDTATQSLLAVISRNEQFLAGYRSDSERSYAGVVGDSSIQGFRQGGGLPDFLFQLALTPGGKNWSLNCRSQKSTAAGPLATLRHSLAKCRYLSTKEGLEEILSMLIHAGVFPLPAREEKGQQVFEWLMPRVNEPGIDTLSMRIAADHQRLFLKGKQLVFGDIRFGKTGDFALSSPLWPELPVSWHGELDNSTFFRLGGAVAKFLEEESKQKVAKEAAPTRR